MSIFNSFRIAHSRIEPSAVKTAMANRIRAEWPTQEMKSFLETKGVIEFPDEQLQDKICARPNDITEEEQSDWEYNIEWMIMQFEQWWDKESAS